MSPLWGSGYWLRKKGSETKKRTKTEGMEKGDYGPPTRNVVLRICRTWAKRYQKITSQMRIQRVSRMHRPGVSASHSTHVCEVIRYRSIGSKLDKISKRPGHCHADNQNKGERKSTGVVVMSYFLRTLSLSLSPFSLSLSHSLSLSLTHSLSHSLSLSLSLSLCLAL